MSKNIRVSKEIKGLSPILYLAAVALAASGLVACQGKGSLFNGKFFQERATETPAPSDEVIEKSFFVDPTGKPKTFMCGWAPEVEVGRIGESFFSHLDHATPHCNLEFEIRENALVGKIVNPSFLNDRRKWVEYVEIPIVRHFYYEREKDGHGRETNEWIQNDRRSHWSARPYIQLALAATRMHENGLSYWLPIEHSTVEDIEWDKKANFLGYTLNVKVPLIASEIQAKVRVNFLQFTHDPNFKKVPYAQENSRYVNILHVMGRRHELESELYAAHWDTSTTTKLYINGVPNKQVEKLLVSAVDKWNTAFVDEGIVPKGRKVFEPVVQSRKHDFDLRFPGITWVADKRIAINSPLGVGHAHADVRNGKILWGGVTLFGGLLESVINDYAPTEGLSAAASGKQSSSAKVFPLDKGWRPIPQKLDLPDAFKGIDLAQRSELQKGILTSHLGYLGQELQTSRQNAARGPVKNEKALEELETKLKGLEAQMAALTTNGQAAAQTMVKELLERARQDRENSARQFSGTSLLNLLGYSSRDKEASFDLHLGTSDGDEVRRIIKDSKSVDERQRRLRAFLGQASAWTPDSDRTAEAMMAGWNRSEARDLRSFNDMYESVVMELSLHELGHMIGLGHQFKENIVPEEGTVPSRYVKELSALATREKLFTNATSVMGYKSGRTELLSDAKLLSPGAHDRLVLHYLYRGEYSTLDASRDDFAFLPLPINGRIPETTAVKGSVLKTSYFPQCNDLEASLGMDPFCSRWDRGSKAEDIVTTFFEDLSDNLVSRLYSFAGTRRYPDEEEARLWWRALHNMSHVRLFYDEMRRRLSTEPRLKPLWDRIRADESSLFEFSTACRANEPSAIRSSALKELFFDGDKRRNGDIRDLCLANATALNEFKFLLSLPESDYTRIDHKEHHYIGGYLAGDVTADYRAVFGTWYQLTNLPLKISALYTLTTADAFLEDAWPNPFYWYPGNRFLYRTLYPREYTRMVAETARSNMGFESLGVDDRTKLGRSILIASWMIPDQNFFSNDTAQLPPSYVETLRNQTEFQFSYAYIILTAAKPESDQKTKANHFKKFTATIYDAWNDKSRTAREVYVLPKGKVFVRANDMFLLPFTKLRFINDTTAYALAYKVDYDYEVGDPLLEDSVKFGLTEVHDKVASTCVDGFEGSGLSSFFDSSNEQFDGFYIPSGIAIETGKEKMGLFLESIDKEFGKYEDKVAGLGISRLRGKKMGKVCEESLRGIGEITAVGGLLQGFWLPITMDFIVK